MAFKHCLAAGMHYYCLRILCPWFNFKFNFFSSSIFKMFSKERFSHVVYLNFLLKNSFWQMKCKWQKRVSCCAVGQFFQASVAKWLKLSKKTLIPRPEGPRSITVLFKKKDWWFIETFSGEFSTTVNCCYSVCFTFFLYKTVWKP